MENTASPARGSRFSPAKINLFLAVTGLRSDGFHNLVSIVAQCAFGDRLTREDAGGGMAEDSLEVTEADVPVSGENLVLRAAAAFRRAEPKLPPQRFTLQKRIPVGAGLGGGSGDAAAALRLLAERMPGMSATWLGGIGACLGSDVPLFLQDHAVIMRGRGDRVEDLPETARDRLSGLPVLLFGPPVAMETPRAYALLRAQGDYAAPAWAEERVAAFAEGDLPLEHLLFNSFAEVVEDRLPTIAVVLRAVREAGIPALMSGSGSACFALPRDDADTETVRKVVTDAWGAGAFFTPTFLL